VAGALVATLAVVALDGPAEDTVSLPPVRQTELREAARSAACDLRLTGSFERSNPAAAGPRVATPLAPGVYDRPADADRLVAALRRGVIVIQYRTGLAKRHVKQLQELQRAVPSGTIVAPNGTGMPFAVAATAWRRLLGCPELTDTTIDAIRLFRGRFLGSGPDG
jgi:hypothetical protein